MKSFVQKSLLGLAAIFGVLLGGVSFIFSVLVGFLTRKLWIGYFVALGFAFFLTLLSATNPDLFHIGTVDFQLHNRIFIIGIPSLAANIFSNLLFSGFGVETAWMFKKVRQQKTKGKASYPLVKENRPNL